MLSKENSEHQGIHKPVTHNGVLLTGAMVAQKLWK